MYIVRGVLSLNINKFDLKYLLFKKFKKANKYVSKKLKIKQHIKNKTRLETIPI